MFELVSRNACCCVLVRPGDGNIGEIRGNTSLSDITRASVDKCSTDFFALLVMSGPRLYALTWFKHMRMIFYGLIEFNAR